MSNPLNKAQRAHGHLLLGAPVPQLVRFAAKRVFQRYEDTLMILEAENKRIYEALLKHGNHIGDCPQRGKLMPDACTCGFRVAIAVDHIDRGLFRE